MKFQTLFLGSLVIASQALSFSAHAVQDVSACMINATADENNGVVPKLSLREAAGLFNKITPEERECTEYWGFKNSNPNTLMTVFLTSQLEINANKGNDGDCLYKDPQNPNLYPYCKDGISFEINGQDNPGGVVIDTTGMEDDRCAIKLVGGDDQIYANFTIKTKQPYLLGTKTSDKAVLCHDGGDNMYDIQLQSTNPVCGNGFIDQASEKCDDGKYNGPDNHCSTSCKIINGDSDGVPPAEDNCPFVYNPEQKDCDGDDIGDACDNDWDNDGRPDNADNCAPNHNVCKVKETEVFYNPDQKNIDKDSKGDVCDADRDGDGFDNNSDNCPNVSNPDQIDDDADGKGKECDSNDHSYNSTLGIPDPNDNCPNVNNPDQEDSDGDGIGDACDDDPTPSDQDGDGKVDSEDNCPSIPNVDQANDDHDDQGNACDADSNIDGDQDGVLNPDDNCIAIPNTNQKDSDGDGLGDACDSTPGSSTPDDEGSGCSLNPTATVSASGFGVTGLILALGAVAQRRRASRKSRQPIVG